MSECRKQIAEGWTPPHKYGGQWIRLMMDSLDCCRDGGSTRVRLLGTMVGVVEFTHLPSELEIAAWPTFTPERPLELLVSACLTGAPCGVDGTSYNAPYAHTGRLLHLPNVHVLAFCPEDFAFGTPRATPDIHGGTGFDVLDGTARVLSDTGEDWTAEMLGVAETMLRVAQKNDVHLALLMDISAACGSQVIYDGPRSEGRHQAGQGVCAALLIRHGVKVLSHRDHRTLDAVLSKLDPAYQVDPAALDHHETLWYVETFGSR
jgi:uncharacterized protein YbbK (DUF523 family)